MAKNLNVSMTFTADTSQAKKEMKSLQDQLSKLGSNIDFGKGAGKQFVSEMQEAQKSIAILQTSLRSAFNVDTGKLDFTRFNKNLKESGTSLEKVSTDLQAIGPEGQQAFLKLTQAVAQSEIPIIRVSDKLKSLGTTLANTARWQISSSVLHGFMGAIQSAYGYAQDLNRSLNDIRIVTGYSADEMAKFAEQANKSAQALSTTTTAYTDAALIFYQQGLSDEEVQKRTDATIKMANVTGENAEHVSSYMTAIWNNFADGSKSLEYYADVMTQLGAATAASSEEIAEGMEKFAAVGETVGLSYEYAAAAVTTVIDKTRQSADIVGTSFKTIFARLEGLQLGETLEDGTTLNKYSKALATVGINIKDQNGELKDMDQILDEMGAKWETLSKDQQVALAQTVGGVRQYTQLIALMDNFDAFRRNVQLGLDSEGTLQQQQDIYAESWEASIDRVRAAWEALQNDIIKDDFFIDLNDNLAKILQGLDKFIDSLGGVKGLLTAISPLIWNLFGNKVIAGVQDLRYSLSMAFGGKDVVANERSKIIKEGLEAGKKVLGEDTVQGKQYASNIKYYQTRAEYEKYLTQQQLEQFDLLQKIHNEEVGITETQEEQIKKADVKIDRLRKQSQLLESQLKEQYEFNNFNEQIKQVGKNIASRSAFTTAFVDSDEEAVRLASMQNVHGIVKENKEAFTELFKLYGEDLDKFVNVEFDNRGEPATKEAKEYVLKLYETIIKDLGKEFLESAVTKVDENDKQRINKALSQDQIAEQKLKIQSQKRKSYTGLSQTLTGKGGSFYSEEGYQTALLNAKTKLEEIGNSEGKASEAYKDLEKRIREAEKAHKQVTEQNKELDKTLEDYEQSILGENLGTAEDYLSIKQQEGYNVGIKAKAEAEQKRQGAEKGSDVVSKELETQGKLNKELKESKVNVEALGTALTSTAAAYTTIKGLGSSWNEVLSGESSVLDGLFNTLMSVSMLLPTVTAGLKALRTAGAATKAAFGWIAGIGLAISIVSDTINHFIRKSNEKYQQDLEQTEKRIEEIKAIQEENKAIEEQINKVKDLNEQLNYSVITKEEYSNKLLEVANGLEIENAQLLIQIGAYEQLNQLIQDKQNKERQEAERKAKTLTRDASSALIDAAGNNITGKVDRAELGANNEIRIDFSTGADYDPAAMDKFVKLIDSRIDEKYVNIDQAKLEDQSGKSTGIDVISGITFDTASMSTADLAEFYQFIYDLGNGNIKFGEDFEGLIAAKEIIEYIGEDKFKNNLDALNESVELIAGYEQNDLLIEKTQGKQINSYADIQQIMTEGLADLPKSIDADDFKQSMYQKLSLQNSDLVGDYILVESVFDELGISIDEFTKLSEQDQKLIVESAKTNSSGLKTFLLSNEQDIHDNIEELQRSFDLINTTSAVEQVNNLVKAFDSIKSGDVKTNEEWAELLGEDFLEQFGEYFVETATGTMFIGSEQDKMQLQNNIQSRNYGKSKKEYDAEIDAEIERNNKEWDAAKKEREEYANSEINTSTFNDYRNGQNSENLDKFESLQAGTTLTELLSDKHASFMLKSILGEEQFEEFKKSLSTEELNTFFSTYNADLEAAKESYDAYAFTVETSYADIRKQSIKHANDINRTADNVRVAIRRSAQEYGLAADEVAEYGKYLEENNENLKDNAVMANVVALAYSRADKGLQDLNSNFETWNKALTDNTEDSKEYAEAMEGFETALQNIFNTEEDISNDFILEHMGDIQKAAEGDLEAITDLQIAFASINAESAFAKAGEDLEQFKNQLDEVEWDQIKIGDDIVDSDPILQKWFNTMNQMVAAGQLSAEEMDEIWRGLGWELEPQYGESILMGPGGPVANVGYIGADAMKALGYEWVTPIVGFKAKGSSYTGTSAAASKISSGGKGGGGSSKASKEKDYEKERYYTITRQIQDATDAFNEYEKAKDRAAGKAKVGYIDFEIENLKERQRLQKEYLKEIEDYYKQDQAKLNFFGATYDENGVLTNYDEIFDRLQQKYKDAVASGSEEAINAAQQDMDAFIAAANQFDKTNQLYQSELIKDAELAREIIDKTIEEIDTKVKLKVEIDDRSLKMLEYQLSRIEGGAFTQGEQMANRQSQLNLQLDKQAATREGLDALLSQYGLNEEQLRTMSAEELVALGIDDKVMDQIKGYADELLNIQENIDALEEAILGGALEAFEEFNAEFDHQSKLVEHQTKLLKSYKDISELVYGNAGLDEDFMIGLMGSTQDTMLARTEVTRTKLEADKQALAQAREAFANYSGGDEKVQKQLEEDVRSMEETVMQGEEDLLSQTQENLQQAKEIFDRTLEAAKQDYLKAVGADDWSVTLFDRATKIDDQYLDDYEKIYHLAKLTRDVNNSIDDTPAFRGKERLREVTEEILELEKEGVKVSQYQVDALRAKYELRLAEIALEDAQNAKSTVRMARDNEGNWSYVYTSDADATDKAQQNYEDKLYEYQKLNTDYIKKQQKTYQDLAREFGEEYTKIANDSVLTPEEKEYRLQETKDYYAELMGITTSELDLALGYNKSLYEDDWTSYNKYTGYKISAQKDYIDQFNETTLGEITGLESAQEAYENWANVLTGEDGYITKVDVALSDFTEAQERALENLGTDLDNFAGKVQGAMTTAAAETEKAKNAVDDLAGQMADKFKEIVDAIKTLNETQVNSHRQEILDAINAVNDLVTAQNQLATAKGNANSVPVETGAQGYDRTPYEGSGGGGNDNKLTSLDNLPDDSLYKIYKKSYGDSNNQYIPDYVRKYMKDIEEAKSDQVRKTIFADYKTSHPKLVKFTKSFDTGGYTGSWGDSGRLAFLHQKELVLNAQDTANMLQMTNMVRELSEYIDFQAAATNLGRVSTTIGSVGALAGGELNQNVHIEATFPNVSEAYEIEEALTNLVNRAAQYANRK